MDWRHLNEILTAGSGVYTELKNLCVWVKDNGGIGSFYRSRHELMFAYKAGSAPHVNSFKLGQHGRYRTNVWQYRGVNTFGGRRQEELALHPTVKPVALIADAIKDVSHRAGIVLDCFGGSGSTLIAAHKTGRQARRIEIDPVYVDRIIYRWEEYAKDDAILATTQQSYTEVPTRGVVAMKTTRYELESEWPRKPDYDVGYGKPPKSSRFKSGQAGNPKGRRKLSKNGKTLLEEALDEIVLVTEAGVQQRMTRRELFYKTLVAHSLKENRFAALLLKIMGEYDLIKSNEIPQEMRIVFVGPDARDKNHKFKDTG